MNSELAKVEFDIAEKKMFDTLRADLKLKRKEKATIDINKLTNLDKGRKIVLIRSRDEMIGHLIDWVPETGRLLLRFNERAYKRPIVFAKPDKVRWAD